MAQEIGVRLAGDNSHFRSVMADSVERAGKFSGEIAGRVGGKLTELKDVSNTIAAALGLNLASISENLARTFSGVSKAEEEALKQLETLSAQVADANIKNARALLTEEQRYQLALQDRDRLLKAIADNDGRNATALARQKLDELKLAEKIAEIQTFELKQADEKAKRIDELIKMQIAGNEKAFQAQLSTLDADERIEVLRENIAGLQAVIASGALDEKNARALNVTLSERQNLLVAEEAKLRDAAAKREDASRKRELDAETELAKLKFEALTTEEKIARVQSDIATIQGEIARGRREGFATAEAEVVLFEKRRELSALQARDDRERVDTLREQTGEIERQQTAIAELARRVQTLDRRGTEIEGQSTTALEGLRERLRSQLTQAQQERFGQLGGVGQIGGAAKSPFEYGIEQELRNVEREIAQRKSIGSFANRFGEDAARSQFGDTLTDRALRDLQDSSTRTAIAIQDIQQRLAKVFGR